MCRSEPGAPKPPEAQSPEDQRLSRAHRLRRRADYLRCYRRGEKRRGSAVTLHLHPNLEGEPRLGITASRKVGNAVVRHRLKRWAREIFRRSSRRQAVGAFDIVAHFWPAAAETAFADFRNEFEQLLSKPVDRRERGRRSRRRGNRGNR